MSEAKARELLNAAAHALRSYEHGNGSPHLAQATADHIDAYLAAVPAPPAEPPREPTPAMFEAGVRAMAGHATGGEMVRAIIKAALDAAPAAEPVAQQPPSEPPQQIEHCNDWADLLERSGWYPGLVRTLRESAARIESDAERIRELEAENARLYVANERRVEANDRLLREIERLRDTLRGVIREADRNTDAFICARALIATPDSAASPTGAIAERTKEQG